MAVAILFLYFAIKVFNFIWAYFSIYASLLVSMLHSIVLGLYDWTLSVDVPREQDFNISWVELVLPTLLRERTRTVFILRIIKYRALSRSILARLRDLRMALQISADFSYAPHELYAIITCNSVAVL